MHEGDFIEIDILKLEVKKPVVNIEKPEITGGSKLRLLEPNERISKQTHLAIDDLNKFAKNPLNKEKAYILFNMLDKTVTTIRSELSKETEKSRNTNITNEV